MKNSKIHSNRRRTGTRIRLVLWCSYFLMGSLHAVEQVNEEVMALQKERIQILENLVEVRRMKYQEGGASFLPLIRAMDELADAKYEAAATRAERYSICRNTVEHWETFVGITVKHYKAGRVSQGEVLEVRASHLRAKIRAAKEAPPKD